VGEKESEGKKEVLALELRYGGEHPLPLFLKKPRLEVRQRGEKNLFVKEGESSPNNTLDLNGI